MPCEGNQCPAEPKERVIPIVNDDCVCVKINGSQSGGVPDVVSGANTTVTKDQEGVVTVNAVGYNFKTNTPTEIRIKEESSDEPYMEDIFINYIGESGSGGTSYSPYAEILKYNEDSAAYWDNSVTPPKLVIKPSTYYYNSFDGTQVSDTITISGNPTIEFLENSYICIDKQSEEAPATLFPLPTMAAIRNFELQTPGRRIYAVGRFCYYQGVEAVVFYNNYIFPNFPAALNNRTAQVIAVPSTFTVTWQDATHIMLSDGRYIFFENNTGKRVVLTHENTLNLPYEYEFGSVLFYEAGQTGRITGFNQADAAQVPDGAVIFATCNTINGVPTLTINGLDSFPYTGS